VPFGDGSGMVTRDTSNLSFHHFCGRDVSEAVVEQRHANITYTDSGWQLAISPCPTSTR
jgi:hypothetical protein